jgi:hypothetical protein
VQNSENRVEKAKNRGEKVENRGEKVVVVTEILILGARGRRRGAYRLPLLVTVLVAEGRLWWSRANPDVLACSVSRAPSRGTCPQPSESSESTNERSRDQDSSDALVKYDHTARFLIQLREEIVVNAM